MAVKLDRIVVLISSDLEWRIAKDIIPVTRESKTPFGEQFMARLGQRELLFFHGGWGKIATAASTQYVIDNLEPELLVNLGTCGSFHESMQRGDLLLADKTVVYDIFEQMGDPDEAVAAYSTEIDAAWARNLQEVRQGILISGDRDIAPGDIKGLHDKYGAAAADWESGAVAWTARRNGIPFFIIRGVSDVVSESESLAYGDLGHFAEGADTVMRQLIEILPKCLNLYEKNTEK